ncbi:MAG: flagellar biosynthetic protein FliR [Kofleriaceae bacterium]
MTWLLALRGAAAIAVLTTLAGGLPRVVRAALTVGFGVWVALVVRSELPPSVSPWLIAGRELVIGATIGVIAALPLLAAAIAGRLVGGTTASARGPYQTLFAVLAAAVFMAIDGHVTVIASVVDSFTAVAPNRPADALGALGSLIPSAVALAIPWLVTAAIVELAVAAGCRVSSRVAVDAPIGAAVPAALAMMTAALVSTFAVGVAALVRGTL